jgi:hypothetical protein
VHHKEYTGLTYWPRKHEVFKTTCVVCIFNIKSFLSTVLCEGSADSADSRPYKRSALIVILRSVEWQFRADVSGQTTGPIFNGHADCPFHCRLTAARPLKMGPIGFPETFVRNCHSTPRTIQNKERRSHLRRGEP